MKNKTKASAIQTNKFHQSNLQVANRIARKRRAKKATDRP